VRLPPATAVSARGVPALPEIEPGSDLAEMIAGATALRDGDVLVVTSKVVSKAEGRVVRTGRDAAIEAETVRVVARRGPTTIARTRHGLTLAAAGVDASNVPEGRVALLPLDPDASARRLRARLRQTTGRNVGVVVSDTAGRTWRLGQTDIAVGVAGLPPLVDLSGDVDAAGNVLSVTAPAVADEVASLGDLVKGKLSEVPAAVISGLGDLVLDPHDDGPGAAALLRADAEDMFALGSREAVLGAVTRSDATALGALRRDASPIEELVELASLSPGEPPDGHQAARLRTEPLDDGSVAVVGPDDLVTSAAMERLLVAATTSCWVPVRDERNRGRCRIVLRRDDVDP
jgi:coenzyme F420-0:L-glutamate ligase / coenzyme F420-1:gamma-L-glutamate ligase